MIKSGQKIPSSACGGRVLSNLQYLLVKFRALQNILKVSMSLHLTKINFRLLKPIYLDGINVGT